MRKFLCMLLFMMVVSVAACENKSQQQVPEKDDVIVRVGSLKGPTSIGLASLMNEAKSGSTVNNYGEFTIEAAADELNARFVKGELDIILVPANVAGVLYNRTEGGVTVLDINTLGVLYMVSSDTSVTDMASLAGKTIYLTGKGTTPDYALQYLLDENGVDLSQVKLEYKSEPTEVAALLAENENAIGLLPQPFVTTLCEKNQGLSVVLDLTEEWGKVQGDEGGQLVTGVTVVRNEFLNEHPQVVEQFIKEHEESTRFVETNLDTAAGYVVELGIIPDIEIAKKAIPNCNIVCVTGENMKISLESYLQVLFDKNPGSVGGALPGDDFYYIIGD